MKFFTSDLHLSHRSVIDFENRPFKNIEEMDSAIIQKWNNTINDKDEVYILGDVSFGGRRKTTDVLKSLSGRKYLVVGNHDKLNLDQKELFEWVKDYYKLRVGGQRFILFHYPIYAWDGKERGYIHLHGHTHTNSHSDIELPNKINVGMDHWNYRPVSIEEIITLKINR